MLTLAVMPIGDSFHIDTFYKTFFMRHILWVNKLDDGDLGGEVNIFETFNKNISKMRCEQEVMDELKKVDDKGNILFKIAGRFLCMIELKSDESLRKMVFIDFKKDDIAANAVCHKLMEDSEDVAERFAVAYGHYKNLYDEGKESVELRVDNSAMN
jgi:hypothetical protein